MNLTTWVDQLLAASRDSLSARQVAEVNILVRTGESWLAAYDLVRYGLEQGWLTHDDAHQAIAYGERGGFGKLWPNLRRDLDQYLALTSV